MQYVDLRARAWHAGPSEYEGRRACNDFSIGIELEGADEIPYADSQYETLARTAERIRKGFPAIGIQRIVGHSEIAPGRKTDPGPAFDWPRLRRLMRTALDP